MKVVRWLDEYLEEVLLTLLLIGIASIMVVQVGMRYIMNNSLTWSDELARFMLVWACFLSVSFCVKKDISIKIDQLLNAIPEKNRPVLKMIRHLIVFAFSILMIPYAVTYVKQAAASGAVSSALLLPMYFIQSAPLVGFILLAIRTAEGFVHEIHLFRELRSPNPEVVQAAAMEGELETSEYAEADLFIGANISKDASSETDELLKSSRTEEGGEEA